jgi:hypothetical protein
MRVQNGTLPRCSAVLVARARRSVRGCATEAPETSAAVLIANPCVLSTELARGETIHRMRAKTGVHNGRLDRLTLNSDDRQDPGGGETGNKEVDWQPTRSRWVSAVAAARSWIPSAL